MVRLECLIKLRYESAFDSTFVLNVQPAHTAQQKVVRENLWITGVNGGAIKHRRGMAGSRFAQVRARGLVEVTSEFIVEIDHVFANAADLYERTPQDVPDEVWDFTLPSRYCESDKLMKFAQQEFGHLPTGYQRVRTIAQWVEQNVKFRSGASAWQTSAWDILQTREGVCRDFAHLMIGLCRALNIPARFVTGIDYGADVALGPTDFHAYTEVFLGDRWYIVDATGISPSTGLLRLGTGRDAADAAFATIYGDIVSWAPAVEILATFDLSRGILLPERTLEPVSTAGLDSAAAAEALAASQAVEPLAVGTFQSNERSGSGQHSSH